MSSVRFAGLGRAFQMFRQYVPAPSKGTTALLWKCVKSRAVHLLVSIRLPDYG